MKVYLLKGIGVLYRLILLLLFSFNITIQSKDTYPILNEIINSDLNIRQKPESENELKKFIGAYLNETDTVFGIIYTPMDCPRCEVKVRSFPYLIKSYYPDSKIFLITVYPDSTVAKSYNAKEKYDVLYDLTIYDTIEKHADIFSYSIGELNIVYFLKVNGKGELIIGGDPLYLNDEFVYELKNYSKRIKTCDYKKISNSVNRSVEVNKKFLEDKKEIEILSNWPISETVYNPVFYNGFIFFNDKLDNSIYCYKKENDAFVSHMKFTSDSTENKTFINLPKNIYDNCNRNHNFFYLANAPTLLADSVIGISYSLPKAFIEKYDSLGKFTLAFYNTPVCIRRNFFTGERLPMIHFDEGEYKYFNHHFNFVGNKDYFVMGTQKSTWPIWEMSSEKINTPDDPFSEKFYTDTTYYMVMFDSKGMPKKMFGNYNTTIRKTLTGTIFVQPKACVDGDYIYYCDGVTGEVYKSNISNPDSIADLINIFDIDKDNLPLPDSTYFYSYKYADIYKEYFMKSIVNMLVKNNVIYCLIRYGDPINTCKDDEYSILSYNINTGHKEELWFDKEISRDVFAFGLGNDGNVIAPFTLSKSQDGSSKVSLYHMK